MSFVHTTDPNVGDSIAKDVKTDVFNNDDVLKVSVFSFNNQDDLYVDATGTVSASQQIPVVGGASGQIGEVNVENGDFVHKGDVLFVITGMNGAIHPFIKQYELAKSNYENAKKAYRDVVASTQAGIDTAKLQLENAKNLTKAYEMDDQDMFINIYGIRKNQNVMEDTLSETRNKNLNDLKNLQQNINDLEDSLLEIDSKYDELNDYFDSLLDDAKQGSTQTITLSCCGFSTPISVNLNSSDAVKIIEQERVKAINELDKSKSEIELKLNTLRHQKETLKSGAILGENQLNGQINQLYTQEHSLLQKRDSFVTKLGLKNGSSTALKLAEQGVKTALTQANSARTQAKSQVDMARINFDLAKMQKDSLYVKAPIDGFVDNVNGVVGGIVSSQNPLCVITDDKDFVLKIFVSVENAKNLQIGDKVQVRIGDKWIFYPVKSVSFIANPVTKLVEVDVALPRIKFVANQVLDVRIPALKDSYSNNHLLVPIDAVTIGSFESYVFVVKDGVAKKVIVKTGEVYDEFIEILSGISRDDELIVDGAKIVKDGQKVIIM